MPQHVAIDANDISGTVYFQNQKQAAVSFGKTFAVLPVINLTLNDTTSVPATKILITTTGFTIKLSINFTGSIDWQARGRI